MQISKELPQFETAKTLILVTGDQVAKIYLASNGTLDELDPVEIPNPEYSDKEGFSMRRGGGKVVRSGSAEKNVADMVEKEFLKKLGDHVQKLLHEKVMDDIILFAPDYAEKRIVAALPTDAQKKLRDRFRGMYVNEHPFKLLEHIEKRHTVPADTRAQGAARKILEKTAGFFKKR